MDSEVLKTALELHQQLVDESNSLWNFYSVIALGVVGLIYGGVKLGSLGRARLPVSVGYVIWAIANASSLVRNQSLLVTVTEAINHMGTASDMSAVLKPVLIQFHATPSWEVVVFHVMIDGVVLGAIWWPTLRRAAAPAVAEVPPSGQGSTAAATGRGDNRKRPCA